MYNIPGKYYEYKIHSDYNVLPKEYIQVTSIDPAKKNYTIRIERRFKDKVVTGVFKRIDLTISDKRESDNSIEGSIINLTSILDDMKYDLYNSDFIFVEKQLPSNHMAVRIAQHTLSYFLINFKNNKRRTRIFDVNPKLKNNIINPPKKTKSKEIKKLSVVKGREILEARNDEFALDVLRKNKSKQDDLCDTICQLEAMLLELNISNNL